MWTKRQSNLPLSVWLLWWQSCVGPYSSQIIYHIFIHQLLRTLKSARPHIYISSTTLQEVPVVVSVRLLSRRAGRGSSLLLEIRKIIKTIPGWMVTNIYVRYRVVWNSRYFYRWKCIMLMTIDKTVHIVPRAFITNRIPWAKCLWLGNLFKIANGQFKHILLPI